MPRMTKLLLLTGALVLAGSSSVAAWHDETKTIADRETVVRTKVPGPAGDPFYRLVVQVKDVKTCRGFVRIPDEQWVTDDTRLVIDIGREPGLVLVTPGRWAELSPGTYDAEWQWRFRDGQPTRTEYEKVRIEPCAFSTVVPVATVKWHGIGRDGYAAKTYKVPAGCTLRTGWRWLKGNTMTSVVVDGQRELRFRTAAPGYYGKLFKGYERGISCD